GRVREEHRDTLVLRPVLGHVQLAHVVVAGGQPVDRVGRKGDELAARQRGRRLLHRPRRVRLEEACLHEPILGRPPSAERSVPCRVSLGYVAPWWLALGYGIALGSDSF